MIWTRLSEQILSVYFAFGVVGLMAATGAAAEHAKAQEHLRTCIFLARAVEDTPGRDGKAVQLLEHAANRGSKAIAGETCYQLGASARTPCCERGRSCCPRMRGKAVGSGRAVAGCDLQC